jgi:hypothetical protein
MQEAQTEALGTSLGSTSHLLAAKRYTLHLAVSGRKPQFVPVSDSQQASAVFAAFRDSERFGASDMGRNCGVVTDDQGNLVARISYNGRVWTPEGSLVHEEAKP